jgi:CRP-like cAMP-binding protein
MSATLQRQLQENIDILVSVNLFEGINDSELIHVLNCLGPRIKSYSKGEFITMEGDLFNGIGIVVSGQVKMTQTNEAGERIILAQAGPGGVFGEMIAFSNRDSWVATVIADSSCQIMFLKPDAIVGQCAKVCTGHKQLMLNMLKIVSNKALMMNRKVKYLSIKSMRGKLSKFLLEESSQSNKTTFDIRYKRSELAEFLQVSRPSMSRELSRMKDEGLIDFYKESFQILNFEALQDAASHSK